MSSFLCTKAFAERTRDYKLLVPKVDGRLVRSLLAWESANLIRQGERENGT